VTLRRSVPVQRGRKQQEIITWPCGDHWSRQSRRSAPKQFLLSGCGVQVWCHGRCLWRHEWCRRDVSYWRSTDRMTRHLSNLHVQFNGEVLQAVFARVSAEDPTCVGTRLYSACSWIARRGMLASLSGCGWLLRLLLLVMLHLATPTSTVTSEIYRWAFAAFVVTSLDHLRPPFDVSYNLPSFLLVHAQTASCLLLSSEVEEVGTNSSLFVYTRCHRLKH